MPCIARPLHLDLPLPEAFEEKLAHAPPIYTPSVEAPSYSLAPGPNEQLLAATSRLNRPPPSGVFTRSSTTIALALRQQEEDADFPTYGCNGLMSGEIDLKCTQGIHSVQFRVVGKLSLACSYGGSYNYRFLNFSHVIWKADRSSSAVCPSMHTFEFTMPSTFRDFSGDSLLRVRPLPPSYEGTFSGTSDIYVKCHYSIVVCVKFSKFGIWKTSKKLTVPFLHRPRTRPIQPILACPFPFLTTIKTLPEEWHEVVSSMSAKDDIELKEINCHLFIPAIQSYALTDVIPFYLHLRAPPESLHSFLYTTVPSSPKLKQLRSLDFSARPSVRVYLLRQVNATVREEQSTWSTIIGEGTLRFIPPADATSSSPLRPPSDGCETLDWEGEVKANPDVKAGTFKVGKFSVQDFIVLSLTPPNPATSPFEEHRHRYPVKLCTNSFLEIH
ncbi:hypothetical protein FA95DRAFT_1503395 [Auriscalpium vulgare]|uniref:Uncharacterized protein n=1 Tax=Auriscalpium vulgare TaxID=40419 RepID=A0ACB8R7A5_9AGAM|nr:hypothetical protein FA95DRAFT_1503395 [Auriscalpium vulgare]